ncbi:MAG: right-handed parallel beta-helix repeat-containing protein, partial [Roseiflexaceae bacterium]|nr:right-handed parallel beta-helix repeat-containing protein [Roseiflexaceae bacterium]
GPARASETPPSEQAPADGPRAAWDRDEQVALDTGAARPRAVGSYAASDCLGLPTRRIRYTSDGVIHLEGCGQVFTLGQVAAAPAVGPDKLELVDPVGKVWLLKVSLKVEEGATLQVIGGTGEANWLRLRSDADSGIWLRAERGNLLFQDTKVTSWDTSAQTIDSDVSVAGNGSGGRSYIAARTVLSAGRATAAPSPCTLGGGSQEPYEARMDVINSEIAHLGYNAAESYGIVWKVYYKVDSAISGDQPPPGRELYALADIFGDVSNSVFRANYFGSYTYGAYCMTWQGNLFEQNIQYGLDPHDDSDNLTIRDNIFRDNGNHGMICSVECDNLVIVGNQSYRNQHGIMLHRNVNGALVEGNISADNRGAGIAIFDSYDAVVRGNTVGGNGESAIRLSVGASRNLIEGNSLTAGSAGYAIYTYKGSDAPTSGDGRPRDNIFRQNRIVGTNQPLIKLGDTLGTRFEQNSFEGQAPGLLLQRASGTSIRQLAPGTTLRITLDQTSSLNLRDAGGMIWQSNDAETSVNATGSSLDFNGGSAPALTLTALDLSVQPAQGSMRVQPIVWNETMREWRESGENLGDVQRTVGGLLAGQCYAATSDGAALGVFAPDAQRRVSFSSAARNGAILRLTTAACAAAPTA